MPISPTYPGVYIEELPSGVHTITGVSTSVTAFAGLAKTGPINQAVRILSYPDYERTFGGPAAYSEMSYAVRQFFLNGGSEAWVIRLVGQNTLPDTATLYDGGGTPKKVLAINALYPGETDRSIDVFVEQGTGNSFSLIFVSTSKTNSADSIVEQFTDLLMDPNNANYALTKVNGVSQLVTLQDVNAAGPTARPAPTLPNHGMLTSGAITSVSSDPSVTASSLRISLDGASPLTVTISGSTFANLNDAAARLQAAVQALKPADPAYSGFTCTADTPNKQLKLASGTYGRNSSVQVRAVANDSLASDLQLLPSQATQASASLTTLSGGAGGSLVTSEIYDLFIADRSKRLGIYALEEVDLFNLLCLPGITDVGVLGDAIAYCEERRAFLIADAPQGKSPDEMYNAITSTTSGSIIPKKDHAAIYYPWVAVPDPLNNGLPRSSAPSGTIAGVYARIDSTRGVWKAPAGTEASLSGVLGLDYQLRDAENGILNPQAVNCLRVLPAFGPVSWGARTLAGADAATSDYKYVPVRRLALYIEESLYEGTKWIVFEPNDEPLWAQIRLNIGAFMHSLFRQGAFQGTTPGDAYLVKCDKETTTQDDINRGIVNILVGFAPLKPAEFVIIQIQQLAGQIQV